MKKTKMKLKMFEFESQLQFSFSSSSVRPVASVVVADQTVQDVGEWLISVQSAAVRLM